MKNALNKNTAIAIVMVLMLAFSAAMMSVRIGKALTPLYVTQEVNQFMGQNTAGAIDWVFTPNILAIDPHYDSSSLGSTVLSNATVTFTRPDGTKDVVNGPFPFKPQTIGGAPPRIQLIYTPDMMGVWNYTFYWPGDSTWAAVNYTNTFNVIGHFERREGFAFLSLNPYPAVGLGQELLVNAWIGPAPEISWQNYEGYTFTFKSPSGASDFTVGPMPSEGSGTVWFNLPLTELGNWTITFSFPGDYSTTAASVTRTITVQQDWIPTYPDTPLPTEPWTFPINTENRNWRDIAGPWMQSYYNVSGGNWNPYTEAPTTSHILWDVPAYNGIGGYVGAPYGINVFSSSAATGGYGLDSGINTASVYSINVIMNGLGYSSSGGNITCFDIRSGKILWTEPGTYNVGSIRAGLPSLYSFSTRFIVYNALTGVVTLNVTGPGISNNYFIDPIVYSIVTTTYRQTGTTYPGGLNSSFIIAWDTTGTSADFTSRIIYNITNPVYPGFMANANFGYLGVVDNILVAPVPNRIPTGPAGSQIYSEVGLNLTTGTVIYNRTAPYDPTDVGSIIEREGPATGAGYGIVYFSSTPYKNNAMGYVALDASTGLVAWVSESTDYPWGLFWAYSPQANGNGMIIGNGYGGVYAFNATNGKIIWQTT
jgi:outer membrane protein assembly factor BamB